MGAAADSLTLHGESQVRQLMFECDDVLLELLLTALVILVWLGPVAAGIKHRVFVIIHPSTALPAFNVIVVLVAMSEHWLGWSNRGPAPGIRLETASLQDTPNFFVIPLLFFVFMGFAYHIGVRLTLGRVVPIDADAHHLKTELPLAENVNGTKLFWTAVLLTAVCIVPFLVLGQDSGFFWTTTLVMGLNIIPLAVSLYSLRAGIVTAVLLVPLILLYPSKQNFFYYLLPHVLIRQGNLLGRNRRITAGGVIMVVAALATLYWGTWTLIQMRDEVHADESIAEYVLVREYGFEVFSILVNRVEPFHEPGLPIWLASEALEFVPQALVPFPKPRSGVIIALTMLPLDAAYLPDASFYKGFGFTAYFDYGLPGALLWSFAFGALFGWTYRRAQAASIRRRAIWPLLVYLPLPLLSQFWAEGGIAFGGASAVTLVLIGLLIPKLVGDARRESPKIPVCGLQEGVA